jgi:hypothetical protein
MIGTILEKTIDLEGLLFTQPELFDFSLLTIDDKISLLKHRPKTYIPIFSKTINSPYERYLIATSVKNKSVLEEFPLTEELLKKLSAEDYTELLDFNFNKYIRVELFNNLPLRVKVHKFRTNAKWIFENIVPYPKITNEVITHLARSHPDLIDKYISDFTKISTDQYFWKKMFEFKSKYEMIFLQNTDTLVTKTDVRYVIRFNPHLIKMIDESIIANSKLTVKEWVLLCNETMDKNKAIFEDWEFSSELKEIFKLDALAEVLSGKTKMSKQFSNAIATILDNKE